jgi:hypothetical protein
MALGGRLRYAALTDAVSSAEGGPTLFGEQEDAGAPCPTEAPAAPRAHVRLVPRLGVTGAKV